MPNSTKLVQTPAASLWLFKEDDGSLRLHKSTGADRAELGKPLVVIPAEAAASLAFTLLEERLKGDQEGGRELQRLLVESDIPHALPGEGVP